MKSMNDDLELFIRLFREGETNKNERAWLIRRRSIFDTARSKTAGKRKFEKAALSYLLVYAEPVTLFFLLLLLPQLPMLNTLAVWIAVPLAQFMTWGLSFIIKRYADRVFL